MRAVDSKGKHLFIRFEGDLTVHSHLRMNGWWGVYRRGQRWGKRPSRAWLVIRTADHEVVQFGGPVLELMTDSRSRFDHRLARLGPDILAEEFDEDAFLRRLREDDPSRGIGDALLDQRNVCRDRQPVEVRGVLPRRPRPMAARGRGDRCRGARRGQGRPAADAPLRPGRRPRARTVGVRAPRDARAAAAATKIRARGQGDDNRTTYWCPACQA